MGQGAKGSLDFSVFGGGVVVGKLGAGGAKLAICGIGFGVLACYHRLSGQLDLFGKQFG